MGNDTPPQPPLSSFDLEELLGLESSDVYGRTGSELYGGQLESDGAYTDSVSDSHSDDGSDLYGRDGGDLAGAPRPLVPTQPETAVICMGGEPLELDTSFDFLEDANLSMLPQPVQPEQPAKAESESGSELYGSSEAAQSVGPPPYDASSLLPGSRLGARAVAAEHVQPMQPGGAAVPVKQEYGRHSSTHSGRIAAIQVPSRPVGPGGTGILQLAFAAPVRPARVPSTQATPEESVVTTPDEQVSRQPQTQRCPHCGRREDGERDGPGDRPAPGRYKARKRPRKENPLAFWNNKYGYTGEAYCKACSESFRSHLLRQGHQTRSGCSREEPCGQCSKVLAGFDRPNEVVFQQYDADRATRMQKRQAAAATTSTAAGARALTAGPAPSLADDGSPRSRKRTAVMAGAFALMSTIGLLVIKQQANGVITQNSDGAASMDTELANTSAWDSVATPSAASSPAPLNNSSDIHTGIVQDSPLWTDPFTAIPAHVHHKFAVSAILSILLSCCGRRAKRRWEARIRLLDEAEAPKAGTAQAEVQFMCCGSHGGAMTWARWLVAFSVVGCVYSLCLSLVIIFTWDITWDAPQQHKTEAVFTTAETLTLFAAMPMFLIRFENLPYRKCFWYAWSFFAFIWVFSTVLRSLDVAAPVAPCVEDATAVNAADATLAAQGSSCDFVIAAGLADCESALAPVGELAHSCDVACGFRECNDGQADTRTQREKLRGELLAILGWIQLAHPLLHVALAVVIWQAVVHAKEEQYQNDQNAEAQKKMDGLDEESAVRTTVTATQQSLSLGLLDKAVTPWLSLRLSNERLPQPPEHLVIDTEVGRAKDEPDDSVYTPSPMDTSVELLTTME